jgi:hypothetical protein
MGTALSRSLILCVILNFSIEVPNAEVLLSSTGPYVDVQLNPITKLLGSGKSLVRSSIYFGF